MHSPPNRLETRVTRARPEFNLNISSLLPRDEFRFSFSNHFREGWLSIEKNYAREISRNRKEKIVNLRYCIKRIDSVECINPYFFFFKK